MATISCVGDMLKVLLAGDSFTPTSMVCDPDSYHPSDDMKISDKLDNFSINDLKFSKCMEIACLYILI